MAQGEERRRVGQHSAPPGRVALVSNDQVLLVGRDGLEKNPWLFVLVWGREVVLREQVQRWVPDHIRPREVGQTFAVLTPAASHLV